MSAIGDDPNKALRIIIAVVAVIILAAAVYVSKRRESVISDTPAEVNAAA
jgi:K(+)-stimulated pyrophosphate-energized sodium pump